MKRQKILPDPPQYRTDIQVMTDRQGNSFAVQKATGQKMIMVSHDVIDSIEYRQLSDGASCLYLRLCQATNVDFREEREMEICTGANDGPKGSRDVAAVGWA